MTGCVLWNSGTEAWCYSEGAPAVMVTASSTPMAPVSSGECCVFLDVAVAKTTHD